MELNRKDFASGVVFIAAGMLYGGMAWTELLMGTAQNMGPGYLPVMLGLILIGLGAAITARSLGVAEQSGFGRVPWRGVMFLSLSTLVFAAFFDDLGMLPGVFISALITSFASPSVRLGKAVLTSIGIAAFCTLIFTYGVHLPVAVVGPWFGSLSF